MASGLRMTSDDNGVASGLRMTSDDNGVMLNNNNVMLNNNNVMLSEAKHLDSSLTLRMTKYTKI